MNVWTKKLQVLQRVAVTHALRAHQVPDDEARRARVTVVTVHENASAALLPASLVDEPERIFEVFQNARGRHVVDGDSLVHELVGEAVRDLDRHVEDVSDVVVLQSLRIL